MSKNIKKRDSKVSKQLILQNAIKLFAERDFSSVSMDSLASSCNLNKAMIFYYYKNKKALYEEVIIYVLNEIYDEVINNNSKLNDSKEQLESFIKTFACFTWKKPYLASLLLRELSSSNSNSISKTLFINMKKLYSLFCDILEDGENNIFKPYCTKDSMMLYFMITGSINLMITTKNIREEAYKTDMLNTCVECDIEYISTYITTQVLLILQKD